MKHLPYIVIALVWMLVVATDVKADHGYKLSLMDPDSYFVIGWIIRSKSTPAENYAICIFDGKELIRDIRANGRGEYTFTCKPED